MEKRPISRTGFDNLIKELKDLNTGDLSIANEIRKLEEKLLNR